MARFGLTDIDFTDDSIDELEELLVSRFENNMNGEVTLDEADPRRKFLQAIAYVLFLISNNIDFTGKQTLLSYATDFYLDHIGNKKRVPRLKAQYATTIMRFSSNAPQQFTIAKGTLVSINDIYFQSISDVIVSAGDVSVDIPFQASEAGTEANGYLPGQITEIVEPDKIPYVYSAVNITKTANGSEIEDDDAYAERIQLAPEGYSNAGPSGAYEYFAKTASQRIIDVKARQISPGVVGIYALMEDGDFPSEEEKNLILNSCNDKSVRPLTDKVEVHDPDVVYYDSAVTYYIADNVKKDETIKSVEEAFYDYITWQKSAFGRGIDPSELYARLQVAGAKKITVTPNDYVKIKECQVAKENAVSITCKGVIDA